MTVPCVPPVVVVSRAARLAWRLRHPFRPGVHAVAQVRVVGAAPGAAAPSAAGCEGVVTPDGGRFLPALPGGKPAVIASTAAAVGAAVGAAAVGAAAGGAALAGAGGGGPGGFGGPGAGPGVPNTGNPFTAVPFTGAPAGSGPDYAGPLMGTPASNAPGSMVPGTVAPGPITAADTAVPVPAPGATLLFVIGVVAAMVLRRREPRRA